MIDVISAVYTVGKVKSFQAVNTVLLETYWTIGQHIVEFEQKGNLKAEYGDKLLERISKDLSLQLGKGFSLSNIKRFRQFYNAFPIFAKASQQLETEEKSAELPHLLQKSISQFNSIQLVRKLRTN